MNNKLNTTYPLRIIKLFNSDKELELNLRNIPNDILMAPDTYESIEKWLKHNNDSSYTEQFNKIRLKVNDIDYYKLKIPSVTLTKTNGSEETDITELISNLPKNELLLHNESILMSYAPVASEYDIIPGIFTEDEGYIIEHEPNGRNECPDIKLIFPDNTNAYIEIKSVLCSYYDDGSFKAKVNNAMKGVDLIFEDMRYNKVKENKCHTNLRNITVIFFFYYINPVTNEIIYFRNLVIPAPLTIDCECEKNGTFKKLGQKSDNNNNTVLNLKLRSPYNKYNTLFDRAMLISTGYTSEGNDYLCSNVKGEYHYKKIEFEKCVQEFMNLVDNNESKDLLLLMYNKMKSFKYNTNQYATADDKIYVKTIIYSFKRYIKK